MEGRNYVGLLIAIAVLAILFSIFAGLLASMERTVVNNAPLGAGQVATQGVLVPNDDDDDREIDVDIFYFGHHSTKYNHYGSGKHGKSTGTTHSGKSASGKNTTTAQSNSGKTGVSGATTAAGSAFQKRFQSKSSQSSFQRRFQSRVSRSRSSFGRSSIGRGK